MVLTSKIFLFSKETGLTCSHWFPAQTPSVKLCFPPQKGSWVRKWLKNKQELGGRSCPFTSVQERIGRPRDLRVGPRRVLGLVGDGTQAPTELLRRTASTPNPSRNGRLLKFYTKGPDQGNPVANPAPSRRSAPAQ